jgi:hypothetical protein
MYARLQNGPLAGRQLLVPDPPPQVVRPEEPDPNDDMLVAIPPGAPFPPARFLTYEYHLVGYEPIRSPIATSGTHRVALYIYAGRAAQAA